MAIGPRRTALFDLDGLRPLATLSAQGESVLDVRFTSDGRYLDVRGSDSTIRRWSAETGALLVTYGKLRLDVTVFAVQDSGQLLATYADNTVRLWDTSTGQLLVEHDGAARRDARDRDDPRLLGGWRPLVRKSRERQLDVDASVVDRLDAGARLAARVSRALEAGRECIVAAHARGGLPSLTRRPGVSGRDATVNAAARWTTCESQALPALTCRIRIPGPPPGWPTSPGHNWPWATCLIVPERLALASEVPGTWTRRRVVRKLQAVLGMMRSSSLAALALLTLSSAACMPETTGAATPAGDDEQITVDAGEPPADVEVDVPLDPPAPSCANGRVVYLNFDSALMTDAASDATRNRASWIVNGTVSPRSTGSLRSTANKQAIIAGVRAQLAPFPIAVVTKRPAAGPYVMVLFGGTQTVVGAPFSAAAQTLDCGDLRKSDLGWVADGSTAQVAINNAIGAIGFGLGLTATTDPADCMCGWDNDCVPIETAPCTLSPLIGRDPAARQQCLPLTAQDEIAAFQTGFCQ